MLWETGRREQSPGDKFRLEGPAVPRRSSGAYGRAPCPAEPSATYFRFPLSSYRITVIPSLGINVYRVMIIRYAASVGIAEHTSLQLTSSDTADGNSVIPPLGDCLWGELSPLHQARAAAQRALSS
jgi:hypothetical protein